MCHCLVAGLAQNLQSGKETNLELDHSAEAKGAYFHAIFPLKIPPELL